MPVRCLSAFMISVLLASTAHSSVLRGSGPADFSDPAPGVREAFRVASESGFSVLSDDGQALDSASVLSGGSAKGVRVATPTGEVLSMQIIEREQGSALKLVYQGAGERTARKARVIPLPRDDQEALRFQARVESNIRELSGSIVKSDSAQMAVILKGIGIGLIVIGGAVVTFLLAGIVATAINGKTPPIVSSVSGVVFQLFCGKGSSSDPVGGAFLCVGKLVFGAAVLGGAGYGLIKLSESMETR